MISTTSVICQEYLDKAHMHAIKTHMHIHCLSHCHVWHFDVCRTEKRNEARQQHNTSINLRSDYMNGNRSWNCRPDCALLKCKWQFNYETQQQQPQGGGQIGEPTTNWQQPRNRINNYLITEESWIYCKTNGKKYIEMYHIQRDEGFCRGCNICLLPVYLYSLPQILLLWFCKWTYTHRAHRQQNEHTACPGSTSFSLHPIASLCYTIHVLSTILY